MLNIVICDDEPEARRQLSGYLQRYGEQYGQTIRITEFASGEELLSGYPGDSDVLLLDIRMGTPDGIETARRLRVFAPDVIIIFITSMANCALQGYGVHAFGFLPKPISYSMLANELCLVSEQLRRKNSHFVLIRDRLDKTLYQLDSRDILCFEVKNHDILTVLKDRTLNCRGTIGALERELSAYGFFQCHAAFLVNQKHIRKIEISQLTLSNGYCVPISRNRRRSFLCALTAYVGELL